jgi:hypothetical protein
MRLTSSLRSSPSALRRTLAYAFGDKVETAYRHGDLFARRATIMQAWAMSARTAQRLYPGADANMWELVRKTSWQVPEIVRDCPLQSRLPRRSENEIRGVQSARRARVDDHRKVGFRIERVGRLLDVEGV